MKRVVVIVLAALWGGPAVAQVDVGSVTAALVETCKDIRKADHDSISQDLMFCRAAHADLMDAAKAGSPAEQEALALAYLGVHAFEPPPDPQREYPVRTVMPFMNSMLREAMMEACTEAFHHSTPVLEECLAVSRTVLVASQIAFKGEMEDLALNVCMVAMTYAPPDFRQPFFALVDEVVARGLSGGDPNVTGDYSPLEKRRLTADCQ